MVPRAVGCVWSRGRAAARATLARRSLTQGAPAPRPTDGPTGPHFVLERVRRDGPPSIAFFSARFLRREEMASARMTAIPIAIGAGVEDKLSIVSLPPRGCAPAMTLNGEGARVHGPHARMANACRRDH